MQLNMVTLYSINVDLQILLLLLIGVQVLNGLHEIVAVMFGYHLSSQSDLSNIRLTLLYRDIFLVLLCLFHMCNMDPMDT